MPSLNLDKNTYLANIQKLEKLKKELKKRKRSRELTSWAVSDYGYKTITEGLKFKPEGVLSPEKNQAIEDEVDFIFKVRNKWIHNRNHSNAIKIQTYVRMFLTKLKYRRMRAHRVGAVIYIQSFMRMHWMKRNFKKQVHTTKTTSMNLIKRILKGFRVHR